MHRHGWRVAALACAVGILGAARAEAATIVFDDFESYGPASQANFNGFSNLTVTGGSVSYVSEADTALTTPYGNGMVDTDGGAGNPGIIRTPEVALADGAHVRWEFDMSGNQFGDSDIRRMGFVSSSTPYHLIDFMFDDGVNTSTWLDVSVNTNQSVFFTLPTLASNAPWRHYVVTAQLVGAATLGAFVADPFGATSGDNHGALIDNVRYTASVPEPASWALLIGGFGGAGVMIRRRKAATA